MNVKNMGESNKKIWQGSGKIKFNKKEEKKNMLLLKKYVKKEYQPEMFVNINYCYG